jgi:sortase (surface protein transpeptidase)
MIATPKKTFSWKSAILLFLGIGLLTAGLSVFIQARSLTIQNPPNPPTNEQVLFAEDIKTVAAATTATTTSPTSSAAVVFVSSFETPAQPVRLSIPVIGVNAVIQSVGLSWRGDGSMGVPTNFTDVGWYNKGPLPGAPGNAVIVGHVDGKDVPKAVFYDLSKLNPGDLIEVLSKDGKTLQFQVIVIKSYAYTDPATEVFAGDASKARLNLITCGGNWIKDKKSYDQRIVVFTELVEKPLTSSGL